MHLYLDPKIVRGLLTACDVASTTLDTQITLLESNQGSKDEIEELKGDLKWVRRAQKYVQTTVDRIP